jgi:mycofactocin biosynthesis protein MftB
VSTETLPRAGFDLDRPWRLSFLKSPALLTVVRSLVDAPSAREACRSAGVTEAELPAYAAALETLASSQMICARVSS